MAQLGLGVVFAGYRIEGIAGRGGMGVVYRATDLALDRVVALKVIAEGLLGDDRARARFIRESRIAAAIEHPHVIPIHAAGEHDGTAYIVMRLVRGEDLAARLGHAGGRRRPPRPLPRTGQARSCRSTRRPAGRSRRGSATRRFFASPAAMRRHGSEADGIYAALAHENTSRCSPPLDDVELRAIAASAARYSPATVPRSGQAATAGALPVITPTGPGPEAAAPPTAAPT